MKTLTKNPFLDVYLLPIGLILLNFILKYLYMGYGDLNGDEPYSVYYTQGSLAHMNEMLKGETSPPFYYYFLHYWIKLFGTSVESVRLPSVIFSSLTAGIIYFIGKRFINQRIGLITSFIYIVANFHIALAHDARVYSLFILLTLVSYYLFLAVYKNFTWKTILLLTFVNILMIYSHLFGIFVIFTQGAILLFTFLKNKRFFYVYFFSSVIVGLAYLPYFLYTADRIISATNSNWVAPPSILTPYHLLWNFCTTRTILAEFILIMVVAFVYYIMSKKKTWNIYKVTLLASFAIPYAMMFITSLKSPIFTGRYVSFTSIGFYFAVAIALDFITKNNKLAYWLVSATLVVSFATTMRVYEGHDQTPSQLSDYVKSSKTDSTSIIIIPEWRRLNFMSAYNPDIFHDPTKFEKLTEENSIFYCLTLEQIIEKPWNQERIILLDYESHITDPERKSIAIIEKDYQLEKVNRDFKDIEVYHYVKKDTTNN